MRSSGCDAVRMRRGASGEGEEQEEEKRSRRRRREAGGGEEQEEEKKSRRRRREATGGGEKLQEEERSRRKLQITFKTTMLKTSFILLASMMFLEFIVMLMFGKTEYFFLTLLLISLKM